MNILQSIIERKQVEIAERKILYPTQLLERSKHFEAPTLSAIEYITDPTKLGIIAEFKRRSPSTPKINIHADVRKVSVGYMQSGASALSILTDEKGFGGSNADLTVARMANYCPILRKDFVVDEYQIIEAKSIGADAILLIAEALTKEQVSQFAQLARSLDLEVILEIHSISQLDKLNSYISILGVNNRNLETLQEDIETSIQLFDQLPSEITKISESGIQTPFQLYQLKQVGYNGFLIGTSFMRKPDPVKACRQFVQKVNNLLIPQPVIA